MIIKFVNELSSSELKKLIEEINDNDNFTNIAVNILEDLSLSYRTELETLNEDLYDNYSISIEDYFSNSDEIYDKLTEELVEDILDNSDSYNSASKIIKSVYSDYKKDGYTDEFWNDLIPMVINGSGYDDTYSVFGGNLYYNNQLIKL